MLRSCAAEQGDATHASVVYRCSSSSVGARLPVQATQVHRTSIAYADTPVTRLLCGSRVRWLAHSLARELSYPTDACDLA